MAASHAVALMVLCMAANLAPAASELVYSTDALAMARVLVDTGQCAFRRARALAQSSCTKVTDLELITTGAKAPKFTGHAKSAAIYADSETRWGLYVAMTTGSDVKAVSSVNYNVAKEVAPTYTDITNSAIGPTSHDAVVLDFWVRVKAAPPNTPLVLQSVEFQTMELQPTVIAKHAAGVVADDTMMIETNGTVNLRLSVATFKSAMTRQPIDSSNPPPAANVWPPGSLAIGRSYTRLTPGAVRVGDEYRIKIRLADVGDRLGESYLRLSESNIVLLAPIP